MLFPEPFLMEMCPCILLLWVTATPCTAPFQLQIVSILNAAPIDDMLLFHIAFGRTVNDISLNAVANLGYANIQFKRNAYVGDTIRSESQVIGIKENSNKSTGVVYVRNNNI